MGFVFEFHGKSIGQVDNKAPLFCIAGPCAIEGRAQALEVASALKEIFAAVGMPFVYKSSFDKANRSYRRWWRIYAHRQDKEGPSSCKSGRWNIALDSHTQR